ncbi:sigma-54-dependent Fis family transcriptional regulator [Intestinimonas sp.]|uniref:sigma-54 interaction domain-containing protein n=1 Tax=Intestinimonas sp. TaxID=1965293 RepID=UPI0026111783|nr:sigma 54-interacting transcriptional regulator [Intestinimonas sp.]
MTDRQAALDALKEGVDALLSADLTPDETAQLFRRVFSRYPRLVDFQEVCEHLYDGIHITDGEGTVLFINQAYTRTTGILPAEILGRKVSDIEAEGKLYCGSVTAKVLERRERVNSVATIYKLNKEVLVTGTPVFDEAGHIKLVVTNTRDFPELKRLEQQLLTLTEESKKANEELAYLRRQQAGDKTILYRSQAMAAVVELIHTIAPTDVTVLITGESGTGKELAANELYQCSDRMGKPFIKVNCAAIPAELLESELFGYEDGAFTGAKRAGKAGMFELANTGVILLDEIGDMPLPLQTKLLRVLQQRELMRIGGSRPIPLDIRVIASTNKDLREEVRQGRFREDLYYRLNVVPIELKPLRERREDIPYLAEHFCRSFNKKYGKQVCFSAEGMELILAYSWPGNIRELENLVERIVVTSSGDLVTRGSVFRALNPGGHSDVDRPAGDGSLRQRVAAYEREIILHTLEETGSMRRAAKVLGVDHSTLVKKCRRYEQEQRTQKR